MENDNVRPVSSTALRAALDELKKMLSSAGGGSGCTPELWNGTGPYTDIKAGDSVMGLPVIAVDDTYFYIWNRNINGVTACMKTAAAMGSHHEYRFPMDFTSGMIDADPTILLQMRAGDRIDGALVVYVDHDSGNPVRVNVSKGVDGFDVYILESGMTLAKARVFFGEDSLTM